jgi:ABC-type sulfate/molybdate transport systems ATPase subunit
LRQGADLAKFALIEASDGHRTQSLEFLAWRRWLEAYQLDNLEPQRWLYFNYAHQIAQAALTGQGVALARLLLRRPRVLFLDEPTNAMDQQMEAAFIERIHALKADVPTLILCTHRMSLAATASIVRVASTCAALNRWPFRARNRPTDRKAARLFPSTKGWFFARPTP